MIDAAVPYREIALGEIWRLTSLLDRNCFSPTRGSFSRTHWAWKFEDFPYPRMQEAVYALARLYDLPGDDNPMYHSDAVAQWVNWGFEYWTSLQHRNGAFDEAYPFEQCLAATAFTSFYVGSAYKLRRESLPEILSGKLEDALVRAGEWLCRGDEFHGVLSNHLAAAAAALQLLSSICTRPDFSARARYFLDRILREQSPEGWLLEYDGADVGYGTHGFFYLAAYWKMTGCERTLSALRRFASFLAHFVHPDGTIGGEYASRNTEFYFPAGFEILAPHCPASASIAYVMRESLRLRNACGVWAMDVFNFMPMLNNLFFAMDSAFAIDKPEPVPWLTPPFEKYFPHSGIWIINRPSYYAIVGLSKGGTVSLFDKRSRKLSARHAGMICHCNGRIYTSQNYRLDPQVQWSADHQSAEFKVPWKTLNIPAFTPLLFVLFRLFTLTLGRLPMVSRQLKILLVKVLIRRKGIPPVEHVRQIRVADQGIQIDDLIRLSGGSGLLQSVAQFTSVHMGSSLYSDIRAVHGSTDIAEFKIDGTPVVVHGFLGLLGISWRQGRS
jgi:hypothetical protein